MAYNIRFTSVNDILNSKLKNKEFIINFWNYMNTTFNDSASFAIDDKDSTKIKVMPTYENKKSQIQKITKPNKLKLTFGKGSDKFKSGGKGDDKTTLQEVGFLICLDSLLMNVTLDNYKPSSRIKVKANIDNVIAFLDNNPDWLKSSLGGAKEIIKKFGASKLKTFNFHHDDQLFNNIRATGRKLSGLSNLDKWNPADVYLIKKFNAPTKNIIEYNDYIAESGDVIGISLKKGATEALHGAIAMNVVLSEFKKPKESVTNTSNNEKFKKDFAASILKLKNHPLKSKIFAHTGDLSVSKAIAMMDIKSNNFFKSTPLGINFVNTAGKDLEAMIKFAMMQSMSISPKSCAHWKLEGAHLSFMPVKFTFELLKIRIKINGNTDTIFDFKFNNKQMKLQLRSKGSLPQFIIVKTAESPSDIVNILRITK